MAPVTPITTAATVPDLWDNAFKALKEKDKQNVDFQRADKRAILVDVLKEVQSKKRDCLARRLKYKRSNGDSVHLYDVCEKIMNWVNKFKEIGDVAMQYGPGHAALPWAAIRFLLQVSVNDVQIFGRLVEGMEIVSKIVAHCAAIEELYLRQPSSVSNMLQESMIATYASILRFLSKCCRYFDLGRTQRLVRSIVQLPETSVKKHLDRIAENDRRVTELTRTVDAEWSQKTLTQQITASDGIVRLGHDLRELRTESTDSASKVQEILTSFKEPLIRTMDQVSILSDKLIEIRNESQLKEDRLAILKWLSDVQYRKHHQTLAKGLLEDTGSWLLNTREYVEWRNSSVSSVLWLHGIPGSGKTYLVANVVKQLLAEKSTYENAAPLAYFYCQRNTAEIQRSNPTEVLRAILKQTVLRKADWEVESSTAIEYKRRKREAEHFGSNIEPLDIEETTQQIIETVVEMPLTIVIDAVDECHPDQRHQLLEALDLLLEKSAHLVKVFVSSRDDIDIVLKLQKHRNIYIGVDDNKEDINRFIQSEIQKVQSEGRLLKGMVSSELQDYITSNLARKAQGMFLWVNLQIQNLCDSRRIKVEDDLLEGLSRLPQTLAGMYSLILENISQIEQHGRSIAETALRWLLCAKNSSSGIIIAACSATNSTERRTLSIHDVLDVCSNLVVYDEALDRFRFAHLSVREFLESQPSYTSSEVNLSVARILLQNLLSPRSEKVLQYASCYSLYHYRKVEEQHRNELFEHFAKRFVFKGPGSAESSKARDYWLYQDRLNISEVFITSPVLLACRCGWLKVLDHYELYESSDCFFAFVEGMMNVAIRHGSVSVVRWLLARNVCPTDEQMELATDRAILQSFMDAAIRNGSASVVRLLLARKIHPTDEQIRFAFDLQRSKILQMFLNDDSSSSTLIRNQDNLILAVRHQLKDIYQALIKKGADWNCQDRSGRTLLFHALRNSSKDSEILKDLLLKGLDPLARDRTGETLFSLSMWGVYQHTFAISSGFGYRSSVITHYHSSVITDDQKFLRRVLESYEHRTGYSGPDSMPYVGIRDQWIGILDSIAMLLTSQSDPMVSVTMRSKKQANVPDDTVQEVSQTLLSLAALYRHETAFRVLLDLGTDPTCPAIREALKRASTVTHMGDSMSARQIEGPKDRRTPGTIVDELRQGPLAWAAYTGDSFLVQSILDQGMDPNIQNRTGQAPLYFAAQQVESKYSRVDLEADKEAIVRLLLHKGAIVTSADAYGGATVLAQAFRARYSEMARMLIENGAQIPKGAIGEPMKQIWATFDQDWEEIRKTLHERVRSARVASLELQPPIPSSPIPSSPIPSSDSMDIATQLTYIGRNDAGSRKRNSRSMRPIEHVSSQQ